MKKVYIDRNSVPGPTSIWLKDAEVIWAGAVISSMSIKHKNEDYKKIASEHDVHFIFDDDEVDFFSSKEEAEKNYDFLDVSEFTRIERILHMEKCFDELLEVQKLGIESIFTNNRLKKCYDTVKEYYENGLWLQDYEADERGELPADLKRGILSQDALYDLLSEIDNYLIPRK